MRSVGEEGTGRDGGQDPDERGQQLLLLFKSLMRHSGIQPHSDMMLNVDLYSKTLRSNSV